MNRKELRQLMECCGSDPQSLSDSDRRALMVALEQDPELQQQWSAVAAWDDILRKAVHAVPVPDSLAGRLVQAVTDHCETDSPPPIEASGTVAGMPDSESRDVELGQINSTDSADENVRRSARRRSWALGLPVGLAAAAAVVAIMAWMFGWGDDLSQRQVAEMAGRWLNELDVESWRQSDPPRDQYPIDRGLRFPLIGWQRFSALGDSGAVAYRGLVPPDSTDAYLLVIRTRKGRKLGPFPPPVPNSTTGDLCVGVWKSNGCLYVLMVPGNQRQYRRVLKKNSFAASDGPVPVKLGNIRST